MEWNGPRCPEGGRKLGEEEEEVEEGCDATRRIGLTRGQKKKPQGEHSPAALELVRLPVPDCLLRYPA